jgi:hypothetical protein
MFNSTSKTLVEEEADAGREGEKGLETEPEVKLLSKL